jgi:hypothetical protein
MTSKVWFADAPRAVRNLSEGFEIGTPDQRQQREERHP